MAWTSSWVRLTSTAELALDRTLTCGQAFTWTRLANGVWCNALLGHGDQAAHAVPVMLREHNDEVQFRYFRRLDPPLTPLPAQPTSRSPSPSSQYLLPTDPAPPNADPVYSLLHDYFQLSYSLSSLYNDWSARDPVHFAHIAPLVPGIRLMRQHPTETLFAFICSSNNNIARITGMVRALASRYGECVYPGGQDGDTAVPPLYAFPAVEVLAQHAETLEGVLRGLGFGYRARFIASTGKTVCQLGGTQWLLGLRGGAYAEVRDTLVQLQGVGRKVADCVVLMSLDQAGAIPVDTHVWQIATRAYKFKSSTKSKSLTPATYNEVVALFQTVFGTEAGWAHSVLFTADLARTAAGQKPESKLTATAAAASGILSSTAPHDPAMEQQPVSARKTKRKSSSMGTVTADVSVENIVTTKRRRRQV